jgi:hypothetical protein
MKTQPIRIYGIQQKAKLEGKFIAMNAYKKNHRKFSNKHPNVASQTPRKTRTT